VCPRTGLDGYVKSRPPSAFDPRTVQPVVSRYTDRAVAALENLWTPGNFICNYALLCRI